MEWIIIQDLNAQIQSFIDEGEEIASTQTKKRSDGSYYISGDRYRIWLEKIGRFLSVYYPEETITEEFFSLINSRKCQNQHTYDRVRGKLISLIKFPPQQKPEPERLPDKKDILLSILIHFDKYAKQLQTRRNNKPPYEFYDEADIQDSLHAILRLFFSDIRAEDFVPEHAGGKSRVDFFIPEIQSIIEVKYAKETSRDKEIGDQLLIDINRYSKRTECKNLFLFIFDPLKVLRNSAGLVSDLERSESKMKIKVVISPY
ncbi:MAG: hypothetical protein LBE57_01425 [Methanosarcinales archaeon]|jgi:hypothetical protein|nr:hypothetical protein [Methanosarcinales archaeon]